MELTCVVPQAGHGPKMAKANGVKKINLENVGSPSKIHEKNFKSGRFFLCGPYLKAVFQL